MKHGIIIETANRAYDITYDTGVLLAAWSISEANPKLYEIEIDGRDGTLDLTDLFGSVRFKNRTITATLNLKKIGSVKEQELWHSNLMLQLHGEKVKITHWRRPEVYYSGRCTVGELKSGVFSLSVDVEPYAYTHETKTYSFEATETEATGNISNSGKSIMPHITVDGEVSLTINGNTYSFSTGEYDIIDIQLNKAGDTAITYSGNGTITFKFKERVL